MKTNQFFSLQRFCLLLRSDLLINYKKYTLIIVGAFIMGFVVLYGNMPKIVYGDIQDWNTFGSNKYLGIFIASLLALGVLVGSSFPDFGSKVRTTNYLLIPSSTFEKFCSQIFIRFICGGGLFLVLFWIDAQLARSISVMQMVDVKTNLHYANAELVIQKFNYGMIFMQETTRYPNMKVVHYPAIGTWGISMLVISVGLYLFSVRLYFKKLGLVKSIISFAALFFILFLFMVIYSHIFYPNTEGFEVHLQDYTAWNILSNVEIWLCVIGFVSPLFLLPMGYFKLKEKQV
ncbi:hypothetical protein [Parabacteroides sp. FAFU027]|uniref:hypothetical protein n=1 Tax=Parabacteroides sp. FAFU027 TaxID=2922715 RepID=UPI001FAFFED3|nr:hypothetical protein [Parabacteroides sp. FAFU027]